MIMMLEERKVKIGDEASGGWDESESNHGIYELLAIKSLSTRREARGIKAKEAEMEVEGD